MVLVRSWTWDSVGILMPILAANFASDTAGGPANALGIFFIARAVPRWWPTYCLLSFSTQHSDGNPHPARLRLSRAFKPDESQKKA
jgi:hypothetical protein